MAKKSRENKSRVIEIVDDSRPEEEPQSDENDVDNASNLAEFDADLDYLLSNNSSHDQIVTNTPDVSTNVEPAKPNRTRGPRKQRKISVKDVTKDLGDIMFSDSDDDDEKTAYPESDKACPKNSNAKPSKDRSRTKSKSPSSLAKRVDDKSNISITSEDATEPAPKKSSTSDDSEVTNDAESTGQTNGKSKKKNRKSKSKQTKNSTENSESGDKAALSKLPLGEGESVSSKPNEEKPKKKKNKKSKSKSKQDVADKTDVSAEEQGYKEPQVESQSVPADESKQDKPKKKSNRKTKSKSDKNEGETKLVKSKTEPEKSPAKEDDKGTETAIVDTDNAASTKTESKPITGTRTDPKSNFARLRSMFENEGSAQDFKFQLKSTKRESLPKARPVKTIQGLDHLQIPKLDLNDIKIKTIVGSSSISKYGKTGLKFTLKETDSLFENSANKELFILLCIHIALYEASGYKMIRAKYPDVDEIFGEYEEINLLHTRTKITKSPKEVHKNNLDYSILAYFGHIFLWAGSIQQDGGLEPFYHKYDGAITASTIEENLGGIHLWDKLTTTDHINSKRWKHINKFRIAFPFEIDQFMLILRLMKIDLNLA